MLQHPALFADLYELTMMQGYFAVGKHHQPAAFDMFYRKVPERGGYVLSAGLTPLLELVSQLHFTAAQIDYLRSLHTFQDDFLEYLAQLRFSGTIRAAAEGTILFPNEPFLEVQAPLAEAQWLETLILNLINFSSRIATKAARLVTVAAPAAVLEFGLRRAQGPNGGLLAARSSYLAGCLGTSNVEAGAVYQIPVFGTHAHSWIMSFPNELAAFRTYANVFPDKTTLLVDTYDTLQSGMPHAIQVAQELQAAGHQLYGVRLDSGDPYQLVPAARAMLDEAGFPNVKIVLSNDLDEFVIQEFRNQQLPVDVYGVGTRLVTAFQEPALGGVYKLTSLQDENGVWLPKIKLAAESGKSTLPGRKQVWRAYHQGKAVADTIALIQEDQADLDLHNVTYDAIEPLLQPVVESGKLCRELEPLDKIRHRAKQQLAQLPAFLLELTPTETYPVRLSRKLEQWTNECKERLQQEF